MALKSSLSPNHKKMIAAAIVCLIIGFACGYIYGTIETMNWIAHKAVYFFNISVNEEQLAQDLLEYKQKIDNRYPNG